jgi:hypothetical protein
MKFPCEIITRELLPVLRALIAKELVGRYHFTQTQTAVMLGVSQAAINYYVESKRGSQTQKLKKVKNLDKTAKKIAETFAKGEIDYSEIFRSVCNLCIDLRRGGPICEVHEKMLPTLKRQKCRVCSEVIIS